LSDKLVNYCPCG